MKEDVDQYIKYALVLLIIFLCYLVLKPYLTVIIFALILAYMCLPIKRFLERKSKNKHVVAGIITLLIFFIIVVPLFLLTNSLIQEVAHIYTTTNIDDIKTF